MKKFVAVICILIVGFACGFYLSGSQFVSLLNINNTKQQSNASVTDKSSSNSEITENDAKVIALHDADVDLNAAYNIHLDVENYQGIDVYEVEFYTDEAEYSYNIDRQDGTIIAMSYEINESYLRNLPEKMISQQEAIDLVMQNIAGAKPSDIQIHSSHDDYYAEYEGRAIVDNIRYKFTVNADKGLITEWETDREIH